MSGSRTDRKGTARAGRPSLRTSLLRIIAASLLLPALAAASGAEGRVRVAPDRVVLLPGESVRFRADAGPAGEAGDIRFTWEVIPRRLGTVDGEGFFLAGADPGRGILRVVARSGKNRAVGHALLRVAGAAERARRLRILPAEAVVEPGGTVLFRAEGIPEGTAGPVKWAVLPPDAGWITPDGLFRAAENGPGRAVVAGTVRDRETGARAAGRAPVRIARAAASLRIRPAAVTVDPGGQVRFTAENVPAGEPVFWSVVPADLGSITPDGLFTASRVFADDADRFSGRREGTILARIAGADRTRAGLARILIGGEEGAAGIAVDPPSWIGTVSIADALAGKGIPFRARIANTVTGEPVPVAWRLDPPGPLRVDPPFGDRTVVRWAANSVAPSSDGTLFDGRLIAERTLAGNRTAGAAAAVRIRLEPVRLVLQAIPAFLDLTAGTEGIVAVEITAPAGVPVDPGRLAWTARVFPGFLGTYDRASGRFLAKKEGEGFLVIRASWPGWPAEGSVAVPVRVRADDGAPRGG